MISKATLARVLECLEHAAARTEVQAATLRTEAKVRHADANNAHARECETWAEIFRETLTQAKKEIG